ncbi:MAG: histidine phosphatase family protein [Bdellovibrionia bacterium]
MKKIYLIRHGETDWNAQKRFQGHLDIPLNEKGIRQAQELIPVCQTLQIQAVLSSDLTRASQTGRIIAQGLGIPLFEDPHLREAHLGQMQGLTAEEIALAVGQPLVDRWKSPLECDADVCYPEGETGRAVLTRAFAAMERFLHSHSFESIAVTSHGGVVRRILQKLHSTQETLLKIHNASIHPILYDGQQKQFLVQGPVSS